MGKHIAEFRKASEDFKRTWEREVAFEESNLDAKRTPSQHYEDNTIMSSDNQDRQYSGPMIEAVPAAESIGREAPSNTTDFPAVPAEADEAKDVPIESAPSRKQDWL